jgi:hypothetical protein
MLFLSNLRSILEEYFVVKQWAIKLHHSSVEFYESTTTLDFSNDSWLFMREILHRQTEKLMRRTFLLCSKI